MVAQFPLITHLLQRPIQNSQQTMNANASSSTDTETQPLVPGITHDDSEARAAADTAVAVPDGSERQSSDDQTTQQTPSYLSRIGQLLRRRFIFKSPFSARPAFERDIERLVVEDFPMGYPRAAAFMNCDNTGSFHIYRRFMYLRTRVLMKKQEEIRSLEADLEDLDARSGEQNRRNLVDLVRELEQHSQKSPSERIILLEKAEKLLRDYDGLLFRHHKILSLRKPREADRVSVQSYICSGKVMFVEDQASYIKHDYDLASLAPSTTCNWFLGISWPLLKVLYRIPGFQRLICSKEDQLRSRDPEIKFVTAWRACVLLALLVIMLTGGLWVIWKVSLARFAAL
ncbi:hypothetical protein BJ508DRAFT_175081 [Ascobolus immersus RN42]|uniref:DUF6594 domain-containing protein n=1 Tax=Ascobolus immersus RN42 TaxID=1160509 RepID=A0A3N4HTC9_ASCIM|nr:hypothetical protein BJ508DRAFT_175081 [Ascobolus immersus RN42]